MIYVSIILIVVIIILSTYLFLLHNELKKLPKKIQKIKKLDSNKMINSEYNLKETNELINEINNLIKENKKNKVNFNHKNEKLNKMITNITHDLRTPLTSAIGYIDLIQKSNISDEDKKKKISVIEERLKKLEHLINSFFEFSKIVSSNESPEISKLNIIEILENCIALFYDDFSKENRSIEFNSEKAKIYIYSNKMMLTRIFDNLIINSFKHDNGDLKVEVIENKKNIDISFENNLNYDIDISKIFDEFYSQDLSRTSGNTGLGLVIVKDFIERLNGSVVTSKDGNKFKINITLNK